MIPICIYYDTECYFKKYDPVEVSKTVKSKKMHHELYSYCFYVDSKIDDL